MTNAHASTEPDCRSFAGDQHDSASPLLAVIIPVFNEAGTINELLGRVLAASPSDKQVIVVNDGSTDETGETLKRWLDRKEVEILCHSLNQGKGQAIRTALPHARGRFTIIQDGDLEYDPRDYERILEPLRTGKAQVVFGSRYLGRPIHPGSWLFRFGVRLLNSMVRVLYGARLTDEATCYKAMSTSLLRQIDLQCERFEFCPELTAKACRLGLKILEVPISYHPRGMKAGKKIRWRDGLEAMKTLWRWRRWKPSDNLPSAGPLGIGVNSVDVETSKHGAILG